MGKDFARRLDVRSFAENGGVLSDQAPMGDHVRLMAETEGRAAQSPVSWSAAGELRNPQHLHPEIWMHLKAQATLPLTCQRCLAPVDVPVSVERWFRFVADEDTAAAQDDQSQEDVLALSRSFDLVELVEDELLLELPLAPRHASCPPVKVAVADAGFESALGRQENPFAPLGKLKTGR